jgi:hypothetical protein
VYIKMCLLELSVRDSKLRRVLGPRFAKTGDEMHGDQALLGQKGGQKALLLFISAIKKNKNRRLEM